MRINIIGGGPAGLYFALLMRKHDARRSVAVFERNAPGDTFGWGVVFSDKTLSYLQSTDEESYRRITEEFETWENVDVVHRGEKVSIRGNKFSGIARIKLLNILQERCEELGVDLRFRTTVSDPEEIADCDLLVGADGVNSGVRERYAEFFRPTIGVRHNKYIWFGTRQLFHGLTLTFRESEAGVFAAHSYKFDKRTSTFIVECDEATWNGAGFASMPDTEARAYLEGVFREDLGGRELLSNNSKWINFLLVKNQCWSHRNVVLLGDALHTAHFSIGSGTKLALEDSIALFHCFAAGGEDVPAALAEFERVRRPVIEAYQQAAYESLVWFEHARDYMHLDPLAFAYRLMTRSKKIDYENLKRRDPDFIAAYDKAKVKS
ncbi:MAG TPA: FAD-dependent monooxygenase [Pyrinomonadaceae bacterium]|jgi:2-polyprenyl-6-methoxyphenol hydroxylase-like FAD-dependent oxidoreductase|nr:FAD-dependent monooxygenase [Pyrinomonadaceae bacterium]